MTDFNIDPNFQINNFNNSINDFNKVFNKSLNDASKAYDNSDKSFQEIFNSINKPIEAGVVFQEDTRQRALSPVEKTASDIMGGFKNSIEELNNLQRDSETKSELFAAGGDVSIHDVMIASQKSALAMQMAVQLRNRVVSAYNELRNISI